MKIIYTVVPVFLSVLFGCASLREKKFAPENNTPGGIAINDTLFCDQAEITNFNWMEYMYWTEKCFGKKSEEYKATLPDSSIWENYSCLKNFTDHYLRHPSYRDFPVVGITKEQAEDFSKWRSDRVFEYYLIKKGVITYNVYSSRESHFTIENYFRGIYPSDSLWKRMELSPSPPDTSLLHPVFRLPNREERKMLLDYVDSTDYLYHLTQHDRELNWLKENKIVQLAVAPCDKEKYLMDPMRPVLTGFPDKRNKYNLLYNIRGNAAEWSSEDGVSYGGGWPHNVNYVMQNDSMECNAPNAWTGFRCVCVWKKWE